jgi:hypothetical protein
MFCSNGSTENNGGSTIRPGRQIVKYFHHHPRHCHCSGRFLARREGLESSSRSSTSMKSAWHGLPEASHIRRSTGSMTTDMTVAQCATSSRGSGRQPRWKGSRRDRKDRRAVCSGRAVPRRQRSPAGRAGSGPGCRASRKWKAHPDQVTDAGSGWCVRGPRSRGGAPARSGGRPERDITPGQ